MNLGGGEFQRSKIATAVDHAQYNDGIAVDGIEDQASFPVGEAASAKPDFLPWNAHRGELLQLTQDVVDAIDHSVRGGDVFRRNGVPDVVEVAASNECESNPFQLMRSFGPTGRARRL